MNQQNQNPQVRIRKRTVANKKNFAPIFCVLRTYPSIPQRNHSLKFTSQELQHLFVHHTHFVGTYHDDEIIIFRGQKLDAWLHGWMKKIQHEVDRLLATLDIQFTMEIWTWFCPDSEVTVEGIGTFRRVSISGDTSFPYLDVQISWDEEGRLNFGVYKKPRRKLVKYLNSDSHHHRNHKRAVLSSVELRLALLTTMTDHNAELSLSEIYPDKHEALRSARQLSKNQKMRTLSAVLEEDELRSGLAHSPKSIVRLTTVAHSSCSSMQT